VSFSECWVLFASNLKEAAGGRRQTAGGPNPGASTKGFSLSSSEAFQNQMLPEAIRSLFSFPRTVAGIETLLAVAGGGGLSFFWLAAAADDETKKVDVVFCSPSIFFFKKLMPKQRRPRQVARGGEETGQS
jgi:hypothetical protein